MICLHCGQKFLVHNRRAFHLYFKTFYSNLAKSNSFERLNIKPKIGLEIHAQLKSETKLFSGASASVSHDFSTNSQASIFDLAIPGTMPRLNQKSVEVS